MYRLDPHSCVIACFVALACAGAAPVFAQQGATGEDVKLEEVVVTAERRSANLQEVPIAVTAFTAEDLERRQVTSLVDIAKDVPNLVGHNNVGLNTATVVYLRGVGSTQSFATVDTTVGFYVDDVYIARQNANNFALFDVERIEVLRGPQGTLYGRNTSGGAIKVVTQRPEREFAAKAQASYGDYDFHEVRASLNAPIGETLAIRLNGVTQQQEQGFSRNLTRGGTVNDRSIEGLRAAVRWTPSESVDVNFAFDWIKDDAFGIVPSDISGRARPRTSSLFEVTSGIENYNFTTSKGGMLRVDWDAGTVDFSSITSYRELDQDYVLDLSDQPVPIYFIDNVGDHDQLTQEFQLKGQTALGGADLEWIAGVFYMKEWNKTWIGDTINFRLANGNRVPAGRQVKLVENDVDSMAAFAQATFRLSERWAITAGLRWTRDEKDVAVVQRNGAGVVTYTTNTLVSLGIPIEQTFKEVTPKLGAEYKLNDDVLIYGSYTRGFKSGGWNSRVTAAAQFYAIAPEFVDAYELGAKTEWLDRRIRLNAAAFYSDVGDLVIGAIGSAPGGAFQTLSVDADIYGLEAELSAAVTSNLDLFATLGLMDGSYKNLGSDPQGFRGRTLPRLPDMTLKIGAEYELAIAEAGDLRVGVDYSYTSNFFTSSSPDPITKTGTVGLVNAYVRFADSDGRWWVQGGCRNCGDKEWFHSMLNFPVLGPGVGFAAAYPSDPRTWRLSVGFNF
jgi:iron complex outermembrane receptor protein